MPFLILFFALSALAEPMPMGAHSLVINQCSAKVIELQEGTTKHYLEKIHELSQAGFHCEAAKLFGGLIANWQKLRINHSQEDLGNGYIEALSSAIKYQEMGSEIINGWVDTYLATLPDISKLPTVLRLSIETKLQKVRGCDFNPEPIEKTLQETYVFQELNSVVGKNATWDIESQTVEKTQNELLGCLALKRVKEAQYMFLPESERGIYSFLTLSKSETDRNILAAGEAYLGIIKNFRNVPIKDGGTFGDLALSRLSELPVNFDYKGQATFRDWSKEGRQHLTSPVAARPVPQRAQVAKTVLESKIKLDQALELLAQQQIAEASDLLLTIVINSPNNRFATQAHEELRKLAAKSLVSLNWTSLSRNIFKSGFEKNEYLKTKAHFYRLTDEMLVSGDGMPSLVEIDGLLNQVSVEERKLQNLGLPIPVEIQDIKKVLLEIKDKLT